MDVRHLMWSFLSLRLLLKLRGRHNKKKVGNSGGGVPVNAGKSIGEDLLINGNPAVAQHAS